MSREPVLIQVAVLEVVSLLVAFGLALTVVQVAAINGVVAALLGLWVRRQVTPIATPRVPAGATIEVYAPTKPTL